MPDINITVICDKCHSLCKYESPDAQHPCGTYLIEEPCPKYGAIEWVAHEVGRDPATGRKEIK